VRRNIVMLPPGGAPPNLETVLQWLLDRWDEAQIRETLDFLTRPGGGEGLYRMIDLTCLR
jgi:hypothetical protein